MTRYSPNADGLHLAATIKDSKDLTETALIMLSSIDDRLEQATLRAHDLAACLIKPTRQSDLFDALIAAASPETQHAEPLGPDSSLPADGDSLDTPTKGVRVLLAEDNDINQMVAGEVLTNAGYSFHVASNGKQAIKAVEQDPYDVVLMDCQMPIMDGFVAAKEIRRLERAGALCHDARVRLPIIALTANAIKGDRERCLEAGMDDYLTKPLDPDS